MKRIRALVVDDSVVFRSQIKTALESTNWIEVAGVASNGKTALEKIRQEKVDLVTLDLEMPELNGIETLKEMRKENMKSKVIVFSSASVQGADITLEALSLGASDFVTKPSGNDLKIQNANEPNELLKQVLVPRIENLFLENEIENNRNAKENSSKINQISEKKISQFNWRQFNPRAIVIGCSTGGPTALEYIFRDLKGPLSCPIFIVQHMPPMFTKSLADRLAKLTGIHCAEAVDGEIVKPNRIYMAPGNFHMEVASVNGIQSIILNQNDHEHSVRPAVDPLFRTAARVYKHQCLGFILTGMGRDGIYGAADLRKAGSPIVIQNKESCVVFGMPGTLYEVGEFDAIKNLEEIAFTLKTYSTN